MKKLKKIPHFKTEEEERTFWNTNDATDYVDFQSMEQWIFPNLKLTSKPITLRIPESLLIRLKLRANQLDIPYQTLMKQYIMQGLTT